MRLETTVIQSAYFERVYTTDYLLFYTKAEDMQKVMEYAQSNSPFSRDLQQFIQENWEEMVQLEPVFHLDRILELKGS